MAAGAETPSGAETRRGGVGVGVPPSTSGTPSTAYLNRARDLAERVQASMLSELSHDPLYSQLASSPATTTFAASRAKEIMDQLIAAGGDAGWRPSGERTMDHTRLEEGPRSDSHHHRPGGSEETDPSTPTPLRTTTNTAASSTTTEPPTGHPQTPSPTPPTPTEEDPIEALLSKATARGVHLPIALTTSNTSSPISSHRQPATDHDTGTPSPSAATYRRERRASRHTLVRPSRESSLGPPGSPPIAFTPRYADEAHRRIRHSETAEELSECRALLSSERQRSDTWRRKLGRCEEKRRGAEAKRSDADARFEASERERRSLRRKYVALGEKCEALLATAASADASMDKQRDESKRQRDALEARVRELESRAAERAETHAAESARLREELRASQSREREAVDKCGNLKVALETGRSATNDAADKATRLERELARVNATNASLNATVQATESSVAEAKKNAKERFDEKLSVAAERNEAKLATERAEAEVQRAQLEREHQATRSELELELDALSARLGLSLRGRRTTTQIDDSNSTPVQQRRVTAHTHTDRAHMLAPAPTPGPPGYATTNALDALDTSMRALDPDTIAARVQAEVAETLESHFEEHARSMTSREDMAARVTDAETKLAAAVEAARRAEVTAARMGEQDVLITSLREQLARADDSLARLTETHEASIADLRRDWERRERDLERRLAEKDGSLAASTAEWERKVSEVSDTMRRDMSDVKVSAARDVSDAVRLFLSSYRQFD